MIYLDNAASTKIDHEVINEMIYYYSNDYANASSKHFFGQKIHKVVRQSRRRVADLINCNENEIYFTSGATEAINTALRGYTEANINCGNHIITTKVEHKAVLEVCNYLESIGIDITYLDVNNKGLIDLQELRNSIRQETILVSVLWVNNETGVIQDLKSISTIVNNSNAKLFVDATQAIGKMPVDVRQMHIDMLCLSAHKFHGPKGVGALYLSSNTKIKPLVYGGGQENGLRSGTVNVPGIIGLAKACEIANLNNLHVKKVRDYLEKSVQENFKCKVIGLNSERSPYISNIIFESVDSDIVIGKLQETVVSTGSACTSEINEPSHVLKNMGIDNQKAFGSIRFSFSKHTSINEINNAINELKLIIIK